MTIDKWILWMGIVLCIK